MSVLVIGGDYVDHIKGTLFSLGAKEIEHWDARGKDITRKKNSRQNRVCSLFNELSKPQCNESL